MSTNPFHKTNHSGGVHPENEVTSLFTFKEDVLLGIKMGLLNHSFNTGQARPNAPAQKRFIPPTA
jgi:hypothetical protein